MQIWGAGKFSSPYSKNYQTKDDRIHVFLNFIKVGAFTNNQEAQAKINELLAQAPVNLEEFSHYLKIKN